VLLVVAGIAAGPFRMAGCWRWRGRSQLAQLRLVRPEDRTTTWPANLLEHLTGIDIVHVPYKGLDGHAAPPTHPQRPDPDAVRFSADRGLDHQRRVNCARSRHHRQRPTLGFYFAGRYDFQGWHPRPSSTLWVGFCQRPPALCNRSSMLLGRDDRMACRVPTSKPPGEKPARGAGDRTAARFRNSS